MTVASAARAKTAWSRGAAFVVFAVCSGWTAVAAVAAGSSAAPTIALILGSGITLALCGVLASQRPAFVPAALTGLAVGMVVADPAGTASSHPLDGPFGYANATAAFFVQACVAALMLVVASHLRIARAAGVLAAGAFAIVVFATRSWTAAILLPFLVGITLFVERARDGRVAVAVSGGLFVVALVLTILVGASRLGSDGGTAAGLVGDTISEDRVALWSDALSLMAREPVLGVGPGRFASVSPTASSDADLRWAHNEFLQAGAEAGLPGLLLTVSIFLWGFAALWLAPPSRFVALAAAGLAAIGIHATVDYVLHFPAVALAAAGIVGTGLGAGRGARVQAFDARVPLGEPS